MQEYANYKDYGGGGSQTTPLQGEPRPRRARTFNATRRRGFGLGTVMPGLIFRLTYGLPDCLTYGLAYGRPRGLTRGATYCLAHNLTDGGASAWKDAGARGCAFAGCSRCVFSGFRIHAWLPYSTLRGPPGSRLAVDAH